MTNPNAAVSLRTCYKLENTDEPFILLLTEGKSIFEEILLCADKVNLKSAMITGLGSIADITMAFYNHETNQQQSKLFKGIYELVSLNGNITFADNKRFAHVHASIGNADYQVFGGHIVNAFAGASTEISIIPLTATINREYNEKLGIKIICTK